MKSFRRQKTVAIGFVLLCVALVGLIGYSFGQDFIRSRQLGSEVAGLEQQINTLETRKVELSKLMQYFDSAGYAESRARLELGLAKPGENVLVVPPRVQEPAAGGEPASTASPTLSSMRAWWAYFFRRSP